MEKPERGESKLNPRGATAERKEKEGPFNRGEAEGRQISEL